MRCDICGDSEDGVELVECPACGRMMCPTCFASGECDCVAEGKEAQAEEPDEDDEEQDDAGPVDE